MLNMSGAVGQIKIGIPTQIDASSIAATYDCPSFPPAHNVGAQT